MLEAGDIDDGLKATTAVRDDRLQKISGRAVHPESFAHGSAEQSMRWSRKGLETDDINSCDTFS